MHHLIILAGTGLIALGLLTKPKKASKVAPVANSMPTKEIVEDEQKAVNHTISDADISQLDNAGDMAKAE